MAEYKLQYAPWSSDIELAFYAALASLKINHDKLDDSARKVLGLYEIRPSDAPNRSARMQLHGSALTTDETTSGYLRAEGTIKNVNTIEEFKNLDRKAVIERAGRTIWDAIRDGTVYSCPSLLSSFSAISFADLKKYKFSYHFNFPALATDVLWTMSTAPGSGHTKLGHKETTGLVDAVQTWKYGVDSRQHGFFLAKRLRHQTPEGEDRPETPRTPITEELGFSWAVGSLSSYENDFFKNVEAEDQFVCFADPSTYADAPAWMIRNLLVLIKHRWNLNKVQIMCYRDTHLRRDQANSIILQLSTSSTSTVDDFKSVSPGGTLPMPKVIGWERTTEGKMASRLVNLAAYMDPTKLADQAVDLNLKLIKWRIAPSLDLEIIKNTKCLLLGAGTLGSYVSRNLMGWGVRKITFVDNASVSFSNPVRQPLFDFKDCLEGGVKKAWRASEALQEIYPGVDSEGHVMTVPMAGHPVTDEKKTKADYDNLSALMDEHDAIFLLMDTRESRWLPTVMAKAKGKIVMNAALGFDTFVVMRQGLPANGPGEEELGCYFCNDVVAPADSLKDATLDQQCTVTRPGIAPIASALLVELLVSILQHPLQGHAPAQTSTTATGQAQNSSAESSGTPFNHPLGLLPHTIRGYLSNFSHLIIKGKPYDCCSACSPTILELYKKDGWEFVRKAMNEKGWVEEVSGLAEVQRKAEEAEKEMDFEFSDAEEEGEGELI